MIGDDGRRRVNILGQIAFIIESYIRILGQFETFVKRFGRMEANLRHLPLICGDCDEWRRLLEFGHNHIATIIDRNMIVSWRQLRRLQLSNKTTISRPLWIEI